jgi:hypothetical protein
LETWRWRRNLPPPLPAPDSEDGDEEDAEGASVSGWVKASFSNLGGSPAKRRRAARAAAKAKADGDAGGGYLPLIGDSAPAEAAANASTVATPLRRATSFNPLLSLFGSPSPRPSVGLKEPLLEKSPSPRGNETSATAAGSSSSSKSSTSGSAGAVVSAAAAAASSFFFGAPASEGRAEPEVQPDVAAFFQWAAVAVPVEMDAFCWEAVDSGSEDEDTSHGDDKDKDDDKDADEDADAAVEPHPDRAAFVELKEGYETAALRLVGMAPFRDKHAWFDAQLRDVVQVPWSAGHFTLDVDRHDLLESSVEALLRQVWQGGGGREGGKEGRRAGSVGCFARARSPRRRLPALFSRVCDV